VVAVQNIAPNDARTIRQRADIGSFVRAVVTGSGNLARWG
jgi:hypothetical protein